MKLNAAQIDKVEQELNARIVPDDHPIAPELREEFGDHTFFVDANGVNIVEPNPELAGSTCAVVRLATWDDEAQTELVLHPPELLPVSVTFATNGSAPDA